MATSTGTVARSTAKSDTDRVAQEVARMKDTPQNRQGIDCLYQVGIGILIVTLVALMILAAIAGGN